MCLQSLSVNDVCDVVLSRESSNISSGDDDIPVPVEDVDLAFEVQNNAVLVGNDILILCTLFASRRVRAYLANFLRVHSTEQHLPFAWEDKEEVELETFKSKISAVPKLNMFAAARQDIASSMSHLDIEVRACHNEAELFDQSLIG